MNRQITDCSRYTVNAVLPSAQTRMTEGLRELTPEQRAARDPKWVSPTVVYLASEEAQDITGRVIQAGFGRIAVCEGWRRGAEVAQVADPATAGAHVREMIARVRKNSGMDGMEPSDKPKTLRWASVAVAGVIVIAGAVWGIFSFASASGSGYDAAA